MVSQYVKTTAVLKSREHKQNRRDEISLINCRLITRETEVTGNHKANFQTCFKIIKVPPGLKYKRKPEK